MSPDKWDEEGAASSAENSGDDAPILATGPRRKFDDEEDEDILDSWDADDDSEVERKTKAAAEAKAKAEVEAKANKKPKTERIAEHQATRARQKAEEGAEDSEEETEVERRLRLRRSEKEADLKHAEDLFGEVGVISGRKVVAGAVAVDANNPHDTVDISALPLFNPTTKAQFEQLRSTLGPILAAGSKKPHYVLFLQEFFKHLAKDLPSEQIKKISSTLTTLSNERLKEEKASDKSNKKSKAAKTKTSLVTTRANEADLKSYGDDTFGDDDFM